MNYAETITSRSQEGMREARIRAGMDRRTPSSRRTFVPLRPTLRPRRQVRTPLCGRLPLRFQCSCNAFQ